MLDESEFECTLKILLLGGSAVGKSNFISRFVSNEFSEKHLSTSGLELKSSEIITDDKKKIKVHLWDTAGQEKYKSVTKSLFCKVQGVIAMFDLTNEDSFEQAKYWIKVLKEERGQIPTILVGSKFDLTDLIIISEEEIKNYAENETLEFMMVSSKTDYNVKNAVKMICEKVLTSLDNYEINESFSDFIQLSKKKKKKKQCCKK